MIFMGLMWNRRGVVFCMEFCPNCGTRLVPKKIKGKEELQLTCPKGDYKKEEPLSKIEPVLTKVISHAPSQMVAVIDREAAELRTLPTINVECPNCGNNKAYVWLVQTRSSEEPSTQFMRCTKCNYTFREMS